jgi:N-succinyldiaminopimelate aminotransferase
VLRGLLAVQFRQLDLAFLKAVEEFVDLISAVQAAHQYLIFATATPLQIAIAYALNNCNKDFFRTLQHEYTMRRDLLLEALNEAGFRTKEPRGAYFILADFTRLWDGDDRSFAHHLIEHCGVAAIPPSVFYTQDRDEGRHLVRFVFCKKLQTLSVAAERLKKLAG